MLDLIVKVLVLGDPTQLHQVLLNLCVNARDAMPAGGLLTIAADNVEVDAQNAAMETGVNVGPYVVVQVADTGDGIPAGVIDKIFDPFFTTKDPGKGTGLGLPTSRTIVAAHGGFIRVSSEPGVGTKFRVYLPADVAATAQEPESAAPLPRGRGETVLLVDDEASIRTITQHTLEAFGFAVWSAAQGADAVARYQSHAAEIDVVLVDMDMPVMDGATTIAALRRLNPALPVIGTSGLAAHENLAKAGGVSQFLQKPYTATTLLVALRAALDDTRK